MLLIYYNPQHESFYKKQILDYYRYYVGYVNQFGHILVQMFFIEEKRFINVVSYNDYVIRKSIIEKKRISLKNRIINKLIYLLDKFK